jgi:hypothetical protein
MHREQLAAMILTYLVFASFAVGYINLAAQSGDFIDLGQGTVPGQIVFSGLGVAPGTNTLGQDYTNTSGFSSNITIFTGTWTLTSGSGYVLTSPNLLGASVVALENVQPQNGIYTVNSLVNNVPNKPFYVFARHVSGNSGCDIRIVFDTDGIHIPKYPLVAGLLSAGDDYFYPMANSQTTIPGGSTITTILTDTTSSKVSANPDYTSTLQVQKDGVPLFQVTTRSVISGITTPNQIQYAAAGSDTAGFIVAGFPGTLATDTSAMLITGTSGNSIIDSIYNAVFGVAGGLSLITKVVGIMGTAIGFTQTAIVPAWLSALLFGTPAAVLIMILLSYLPGIGGG